MARGIRVVVDKQPSRTGPILGWAAASLVLCAGATYAATGRVMLSLVVGFISAAVAAMFWFRLFTLGERPPSRRRHVDDSKLS